MKILYIASNFNNNMDGIVSKNTVALPLGIRCMELNIKETDEVIKEFLIKNRSIFDFSNTPSWKFPHMNIEKLDVFNLMEIYRTRSVSEEKQYLELMEILIDRLYFSLIATFQFLTSSENSSTGAMMGQGDCNPVQMPWDMEKIKQSTSTDEHAHRPFQMSNVGDLLRQIHAKLLSINIGQYTENGNTKFDKIICKKSVTRDSIKIRHSLTQTEFSTLVGCESCYLSQNLLKFLANIVSLCFKVFANGEESQITKLRQDLNETVWMFSQRAAILKWCETIESDCHIMLEKAGQIVQTNLTIKDQFDDFQLKSDQKLATNELLNEDLRKKLKLSEDELQNERNLKRNAVKQRDTAVAKANDVERLLLNMTEEVKGHELENIQLKEEVTNLINSQKELEAAQLKCSTEFHEAKKEMVKAVQEMNAFSRQCSGLEAQVALKDQEIHTIKTLSDQNEKEKLELRNTLASTTQQLEVSKKSEIMLEKGREADEEERRKLKDSLEYAESQIELLTLYPDLNGPINQPTRETGNPLQAMELQLKSNILRMEVLKAQTERLNATLIKLRSHMKSR